MRNRLLGLSNAAPEWQAGNMWWRGRELAVACPLEGLVRRSLYLLLGASLR
jgi:hypothetical protein